MKKNNPYPLNRRLKKSEVKDVMDDGAKLHKEFSRNYFEEFTHGIKKQDLVYELTNGYFMLVFDPEEEISFIASTCFSNA